MTPCVISKHQKKMTGLETSSKNGNFMPKFAPAYQTSPKSACRFPMQQMDSVKYIKKPWKPAEK